MKFFFIHLLLALIIVVEVATLYAQVCVPNKVQDMNLKVMPGILARVLLNAIKLINIYILETALVKNV